MADNELTLKIDGKDYRLDDFELGELEWLEDELGVSLNDMNALASMKAAVRFVYLVKHREDPEFTLEDARKLKLSVIEGEEETNGKIPPPNRAARRAAPKAKAA